MALPKYIL
jgi:hypothetical protein